MDYANPAACLDLLQKLHPVNIKATHATLASIVHGLRDAAPAPNQHFEVLEAAREMLAFTQGELARNYSAHPLPPNSEENQILLQVVRLWQTIAQSYAQIAQLDAREGTLEDQRALLAQRRVHYNGQALLEYFRAHRAVPTGLWAAVHASYADAVHAGLAKVRVADSLNEVWHAQSPLEAYVSILLVELANPFGRSERELHWVVRWAQRFAPYCAVDDQIDAQKPTTYGVDLHGDQGLRPLGLLTRSPSLLRFDGSALATQIQAVLAQFKRGVKPASLGLGEDCPTDASARLLLSLYRPWGQAAAGRRFPRRNQAGTVEMTGDWLAIGLAVQGELFRQPQSEKPIRRLRDDMATITFGERVALADNAPLATQQRKQTGVHLGLDCERWTLLDQSVGGFRIEHPENPARFEHRQLVGLKPADGTRFLLATICWLMFRDDSTLEAGISVLPGDPRVVAVRQTNPQGPRDPYHQAFLLPAEPALKTGASIVLPGYWFQADRILELHENGVTRELRLVRLLLRGANFDQCAFELIPARRS
jgi:cyclic-di-GMP-binding protein